MPTVRRGDQEVTIEPGESLQTAIALLDEQQRLYAQASKDRALAMAQHGHVWGPISRCCLNCKISQIEYHAQTMANKPVCVALVRRVG